MICAGQILFKVISKNVPTNFSFHEWLVFIFSPVTLLVLGLYGIATFLWIYLLKFNTLSELYPVMALSYVIVPIASYFFFNEKLSVNLLVGSSLIIIGVIIAVR